MEARVAAVVVVVVSPGSETALKASSGRWFRSGRGGGGSGDKMEEKEGRDLRKIMTATG